MLVSTLAISSVHAKPVHHAVTVKKALPVEQAQPANTTPAKVVSGDGTATALVVLPPGFENRQVVVADSQEYKDLLVKNETLEKQVAAEKKQLDTFNATTAKVQQDQQEALVAEQKHSSSLFSYLHWISWIGGGSMILGAIGVIVLCCFCPALIPVVAKWVIWFIEAFFKVLVEVAEEFEKLVKFVYTKKAATPAPTPVTPAK